MPDGLVHIYTGDGKGKTTAAVGLAVRMLGSGRPVVFAQFLKPGTSSELEMLRRLGAEVVCPAHSDKFLFQMDTAEREACRMGQQACFAQAVHLAQERGAGLLVLDEVLDAVGCGLLEEAPLYPLAGQLGCDVVLTGRAPSEALCQLADYLSEIRAVKHPYQRGIHARVGIEY